MTITTVNSVTEETLSAYPEMSAGQVEDVLRNSDEAFQAWRRRSRGQTSGPTWLDR